MSHLYTWPVGRKSLFDFSKYLLENGADAKAVNLQG
jgi:hypothetical protein